MSGELPTIEASMGRFGSRKKKREQKFHRLDEMRRFNERVPSKKEILHDVAVTDRNLLFGGASRRGGMGGEG